MNYLGIIGDIKESKKQENRNELQIKLNEVLNDINKKYATSIAANFLITLGDEFQGLLTDSKYVMEIVKEIQRKMYPTMVRIGIGVGEITTQINKKFAIGADGPAYYAARSAIKNIREQEKNARSQAYDIRLEYYSLIKKNSESVDLRAINALLKSISLIENLWTEEQRVTIWDMIIKKGNQMDCAGRLKTSQSTVARRLKRGHYVTYIELLDVVSEEIEQFFNKSDKSINLC